MPSITTDAYLDFDKPWLTTGNNGQPNINTKLSYASAAGDESIVVESRYGFPTSYPDIFPPFLNNGTTITGISGSGTVVTYTAINSFVAGQSVTIIGSAVSGFNGTFTIASATQTAFTVTSAVSGTDNPSTPTATAILANPNYFALPEIGRLSLATASSDTTITFNPTHQLPVSAPFTFTIGTATFTAYNITYNSNTGSTPSAVINLPAGITVGSIYSAGTPIHLAALDTKSSYTSLEVPRFFLTGTGINFMGNGQNYSYLPVSPLPYSIAVDTPLTIRQGLFYQDLIVRNGGLATDAQAGSTVINVANSKFTATVTTASTLTITASSASYLAGNLFVGQQIFASGSDTAIGTISAISATSINPVLTITVSTSLGTVGSSYTYYSAFYAFYNYNATNFGTNGVVNSAFNQSGNTDAVGAIISVQLAQPLSPGDFLVLLESYTATTSGSTAISTTPTTITLTAPPTNWLNSGTFSVIINKVAKEVFYTGISGSTLTGVSVTSGSFTIPSGATLTTVFSQLLEVDKAATVRSKLVSVKSFQPNYAYNASSTIVKTYELSIDTGNLQEKIYPVSAPVSLNADNISGPYQVLLGTQMANSHTAGSQVLWYQMPQNPNIADICYRPDLNQFQMYDGLGWRYARVQSVQPIYTMLGANGGLDKELFSLYDPINKTETQQDTFTNNSSVAYTTHFGSLFGNDPNNVEWTHDVLSRVQMHIQAAVPPGKQVAFRSLGMHIVFRSAPSVDDVLIKPTDTVTFSAGETPAIGWKYSDFDEDPQNGWEVRVFDETTYQSAGFSPNTSTPVWSKIGNDDSTQVLIDSSIGFKDNTLYYAYVRVSKSFQNASWFGDWNVKHFLVDPAQPQLPMMAVYSDGDNAINHLIVQSSDNLLSSDNADFPTSTGNWQTTSADSAGTKVSLGAMATHISTKLDKTKIYSQLPVGTDAKLGTAITTTSQVGNITINGAGLPVSGTFWVNIGGTVDANTGLVSGGENVLLQTVSQTATSGVYSIQARNYPVPSGPTGTSLSTHALNENVSFGLQSPVYHGSTAKMSWTEKIEHTTKKPEYSYVQTGAGSAAQPVRFQILKGNSKEHPLKVMIYDPHHAFYAPGQGTGKKINVYYTHFTVAQLAVSGTGGKKSKKKLKTTTKVVQSNLYEVATIASVHAAGPEVKGGWIDFGVTTADAIGFRNLVSTSPIKYQYQNLRTVPIRMTNSSAASLFDRTNGCSTQALIKAGTQVRFVNGSSKMTATLSADWHGPNVPLGTRGDTSFSIKPIGNGWNFQKFGTKSTGPLSSSSFKIPSGTQIQVYQAVVPSPNKIVYFEKNTIGQGEFKGLYTSVGDYLESANLTIGGTAGTGFNKLTGAKVEISYTLKNFEHILQLISPTGTGYTVPFTSGTTANTTGKIFQSVTLTGTATANQYQGWAIRGDGIEPGTRITSNTTTSGGTFAVTLSNPGNVLYSTPASTTATNLSPNIALSSPSYNLTPPAITPVTVTPAGSRIVYVGTFQPKADFPQYTPVFISAPTKFTSSEELLNPLILQPSVPTTGAAGTTEIGIYDGLSWSSANSASVTPSGWYGLAGFVQSINSTYFALNAASASGTTFTLSTTAPAGLLTGMTINGSGISAGTKITGIAGDNVTLTLSQPVSTTAPLVSTTAGYIAYSVPTFNAFIDWYDEAGNFISTSNGKTHYDPTSPIATTADFGVQVCNVGLDLNSNPNSTSDKAFYPQAIVAQAPSQVVVATNATFAYSTGTTTQGTFSLPSPTTLAINAGTTLTTGQGVQVVTIGNTPIGSSTILARVTAQPQSPTSLYINATRACPRLQLANVVPGDIYALSNVMFQAVTPPLPIDGTASNYTVLNSAIPTISAACDPTIGTGTSLAVPASTPMDGAQTLWVLDPTNDKGTRELKLGADLPNFTATLTEPTFIGAKFVNLSNVDDLADSGQIVLDYGNSNEETVIIDAANWDGSLTVPLTTPIWYVHASGSLATATAAGLATEVLTPQAIGTNVAAITWNNSGWLNEANDSYTVKIDRTEDNGTNWTTLRKAKNLPISAAGVAYVDDYECSPSKNIYYRVQATSTNNDSTTPVAGLTSPSLGPTQLTVNSWWISSSSDVTLRFPILVQNKVEESQKHPVGIFYPLGSSRPYTIAGVVQGRDSKLTVIWENEAEWPNFLNLLNTGETLILIDPVEAERRYVFIQTDVQVTHYASTQPYRELVIDTVEAAPPGYGYTYGS